MSRRDKKKASSSEGSEGSETEDVKWIPWFCGLKGNEFFCEVDEEFIRDEFNLTGLRSIVPNYDYAMDLILNADTIDELSEEQHEIVNTAADILYGLIHARYILTQKGMSQMLEKYRNSDFGRCPRVLCGGQSAIPVGQTDQPRINTLKIFCPKCEDIYYPRLRRHSNIDGAYFGTSFAHLLLQCYPDMQPVPAKADYVPRIYGFKIHPSARQHRPRPRRRAHAMEDEDHSLPLNGSSSSSLPLTPSSSSSRHPPSKN
eukprot:CAMPEP_0184338260 /NCGR_PEP_ID=MMETSP1089-20130417/6794_1 /TAXON_ID=38269 ORGANISM="Gloeochaete wittrockiana, Strain SAG46.84" /NCGR_SAMPLE_ID=MMETSP1089 /ASSEMBLY_ACC=CAM_ASM_000445 /LENGTH=257 /DNA_ID=CAMNT_0026664669 /DNA_START=129 /DNA_END=902 /DNA_ORIENTATION=+